MEKYTGTARKLKVNDPNYANIHYSVEVEGGRYCIRLYNELGTVSDEAIFFDEIGNLLDQKVTFITDDFKPFFTIHRGKGNKDGKGFLVAALIELGLLEKKGTEYHRTLDYQSKLITLLNQIQGAEK